MALCMAAPCTVVAACGTASVTPTAPSGPPPAGSAIVYTAVGASDVIGFGSSKPCLPYEDCDGGGYVWVAARQLRSQRYTVRVVNLGIPTAVISRAFQDLGTQNGRTIAGNLIDQEMPFVERESTMVTVFTGANDVIAITAALGNGAGGSDPAAFIDQKVSAFRNEYATLLSGIRARAPSARIVVLNLPNLARLPFLAAASTGQKQAAQRASVAMTTGVLNPTSSATVVDLMCDARLYQASNYSSDGFHPNDSGYAILGAEIARAVTDSTYPTPRSSCPQMTSF
jgi:lysophospholipase L1-like esterase